MKNTNQMTVRTFVTSRESLPIDSEIRQAVRALAASATEVIKGAEAIKKSNANVQEGEEPEKTLTDVTLHKVKVLLKNIPKNVIRKRELNSEELLALSFYDFQLKDPLGKIGEISGEARNQLSALSLNAQNVVRLLAEKVREVEANPPAMVPRIELAQSQGEEPKAASPASKPKDKKKEPVSIDGLMDDLKHSRITVGEMVQAVRESKGMSRKAFADSIDAWDPQKGAIKVKTGAVAHWESTGDVLIRSKAIAEALAKSLSISGSDNQKLFVEKAMGKSLDQINPRDSFQSLANRDPKGRTR